MNLFSEYSFWIIITLIIFPFIAGFIDAVVGGGGLIQIPVLLINFPNLSLPTLFGTNKISALAGTSVAAVQFSRRIKFNYTLLLTISAFAFTASFFGARIVSYLDSEKLKPVILFILILIAIYTFIKKDLGKMQSKELSLSKQLLFGSIIGLVVGFYDGFFGPGTGSFFVLGFVVILGFEFIQASAYTKIINCVTNISALIVFMKNGDYILEIAILMAISNMAGNFLGTHLAFKKGNSFVRKIFLVIVTLMIVRYGYDVFIK